MSGWSFYTGQDWTIYHTALLGFKGAIGKLLLNLSELYYYISETPSPDTNGHNLGNFH